MALRADNGCEARSTIELALKYGQEFDHLAVSRPFGL